MTNRLMRRLILLVLGTMLLTASGCIRRTMTINTVPQGARVILNDQEVGTSPLKLDFTWYGKYSVILQKEGYKTLQTHQLVETPWYELPGVDFMTEVFWPFPVHDQREYTFEMEVAGEPVPPDKLLNEAKQFRERALFGED
jgi:hypothetical protein